MLSRLFQGLINILKGLNTYIVFVFPLHQVCDKMVVLSSTDF